MHAFFKPNNYLSRLDSTCKPLSVACEAFAFPVKLHHYGFLISSLGNRAIKCSRIGCRDEGMVGGGVGWMGGEGRKW